MQFLAKITCLVVPFTMAVTATCNEDDTYYFLAKKNTPKKCEESKIRCKEAEPKSEESAPKCKEEPAPKCDGPVLKCGVLEQKCAPAKKEKVKEEVTPLTPGYNATAAVNAQGIVDLAVVGGFVYWQLAQDNMEVGYEAGTSLNPAQTTSFSTIKMPFKYAPGFKFGLGTSCGDDDWDTLLEFTRVYAKNRHDAESNTPSSAADVRPILPPWSVIIPRTSGTATYLFNQARGEWHCHLNVLDWDLGRSYYVGNSLTFRPALGLRAAVINQNVEYSFATLNAETTAKEVGRSHSWGIGPRVSLGTNWIFGQGAYVLGNMGGDILYTKYRLQGKAQLSGAITGPTSTSATIPPVTGKERCFVLQPHVNLELGLGWGTYLDDGETAHFDLSASYEFQVFFNQNMLRKAIVLDPAGIVAQNTVFQTNPNRTVSGGNLYAQGLSLTMRFDF